MNSTTQRSDSQAPNAESIRVNQLRHWAEAIRRLEVFYEESGPVEGVFIAVRVAVELAAWTRELGVFDNERIASLREIFPHGVDIIPGIWAESKEAVEASKARNRSAAIRRLDAGGTARVNISPLVTGQEISQAYRVDRMVKLLAFGGRLVRCADGTTTRTTKFKSLLPDFRAGERAAASVRPVAR